MNSEKILHAMNDIDDAFLLEARQEPASGHRRPRLGVLIAAVIALMALTVTAFAAGEISGWFSQYFTRKADAPLSSGQIQFIEKNEQIIQETQIQGEYSLEVLSVLSDQETVYVTLRVTPPEQAALNTLDNPISLIMEVYAPDGTLIGSSGASPANSSDTPEGALDFVVDIRPASGITHDQWRLRVQELTVLNYDREYEQELLDTKYKDQTNILFTDEEGARIYQYTTLAEGPWEFTIDLTETAEISELEMISTPVTAQTCYGFSPDGTPALEEVSITSFILRPLGATIYAQSMGALDFTYDYEKPIFVVMEDGSQILLLSAWGAMGEQHLECASPIVLDEVDHILMPDGTKITAP